MAKALITMRDGATVTIEGSQDEVAELLARFNGQSSSAAPPSQAASRQQHHKSKSTPMGLILELVGEGFFREPKELGAIRLALKEKGHFYPVTTLSPLMLRLVRRKELRRIKDQKRWTYVG
jgi:hypothetical protein